tara:strand:+ start:6477 stop:7502 length:1026 start_codon:yes stop_codon:yes gene_type:complete
MIDNELKDELLHNLLKRVSRSFYLTLTVLPHTIRTQIALAYLFARIADTITDAHTIDIAQRQHCLTIFREQFQTSGSSHGTLKDIQTVLDTEHPIESDLVLFTKINDCFTLFHALMPADQNRIRNLMLTLINGMNMDLNVFSPQSSSNIIALPTLNDLDIYTYYVAGCVGEFWTHLSIAHIPSLSHWESGAMCERGIRFGKGLQLTNILKDLSKDLRKGRCYLPLSLLQKHQLTPKDLLTPDGFQSARPILMELIDLTIEHLDMGWQYTLSIPRHAIRLRLACLWPILFAVKTLRHVSASIERHNPNIDIKISRKEVYATMFFSSMAIASNRLLTAYYHQR